MSTSARTVRVPQVPIATGGSDTARSAESDEVQSEDGNSPQVRALSGEFEVQRSVDNSPEATPTNKHDATEFLRQKGFEQVEESNMKNIPKLGEEDDMKLSAILAANIPMPVSSAASSVRQSPRDGTSSSGRGTQRAVIDTEKGYFHPPSSTVASATSPIIVPTASPAEEKSSSPTHSARLNESEETSPVGSPTSSPSAGKKKPVVVSRSSSKATAGTGTTTVRRSSAHAGPRSPVTPTRASTLAASASIARLRPASAAAPLSPNGAPIQGVQGPVVNWEFPTGAQDGTGSPKKHAGAGVFKQYFSPNQQNASSAYLVWQNGSESKNTVVPAPMAEFVSTLTPSPGRDRVKQMEQKAKRSLSGRTDRPQTAASSTASGSNSLRESALSPHSHRANSATRTLGQSQSAATLPFHSSSVSALGIAHSSTAAREHAGREAAEAYTRQTGESSFARRMIHAQSAAELYVPPPIEPLSDDPEAKSLFFEGKSNQKKTPLQQPSSQAPVASSDEEEESQAVVPFDLGTPLSPSNASLPVNAANTYSSQFSRSHPSTRPQTSAGISSRSGVAWSEKLTATLAAEDGLDLSASPGKKTKKVRPSTSTPTRSYPSPAQLPPELTVGVQGMSPSMQREHAALAKLIRGLEPAGKASLGPGSLFGKLNTSSRTALFNKVSSEPSMTTRIEHSTEADEFLRKRSVQKAVENRAQSSSALGGSRGPSGLAGNNLSVLDVTQVVQRSASQWDLSEERPRPVRPATAGSHVVLAAAAATAGPDVAAKILAQGSPTGKKSRPGTSGSTRPSTSGGSRSSLGSSNSAANLLLPGHGVLSPSSGTSAGSVLGFNGSIDRFSSAIDAHRHAHAAAQQPGSRGMLASRSASVLLGANGALSGGANHSGSSSALDTPHQSGGSNKRFASLALEFEVSLAERLSRCSAQSSLTATPAEALERLDVFRTTFDALIVHSPHFGGLLAKVKAEYESFARRGGGQPHSASNTSKNKDSTIANSSPASLNQQQVEDALVLENHRLNTKLHGFQRAYTSLYAKYKTLFQTVKVQEGILAQNALVLKDLNEQLQQAILSSMSEEERRLARLREEGFLLSNETGEDEQLRLAKLEQQKNRADIPNVDIEQDLSSGDELDLDELMKSQSSSNNKKGGATNLDTEAYRRAKHARRVARAKEKALREKQRENDPLERGRKLMREYKGPVDPSAITLQYDKENNLLLDEKSGETLLSPQNLVNFLDQQSGVESPGVRSRADQEILSSHEDPLEYLQSHSKKDMDAMRSQLRLMEEKLLSMQTQVDQSKSKELAALMAMEEFSKQRYLEQREQQQAASVASSPKNESQSTNKRVTPTRTSATVTAQQYQVPSHAMLENIVPSSSGGNRASGSYVSVGGSVHSRVPSIPSLPLDPLVSDETLGYQNSLGVNDAGDEDPDNHLAEDQLDQRAQFVDAAAEAAESQRMEKEIMSGMSNSHRRASLIQQAKRN